MSIKWNPNIQKYKPKKLLGEGFYGKVYELTSDTVLKITKMKDNQNKFQEIQQYQYLGSLQKKYNFINKVLEFYIDDDDIYEVQEKVDESIQQLLQRSQPEMKKIIINNVLDFVMKTTKKICHHDLHLGNIGIKNGKLLLIDAVHVEEWKQCWGDILQIQASIILSFIIPPSKSASKYLSPPYKKLGQKVTKLMKDERFIWIWKQFNNMSIISRQQISVLVYEYDKRKTKPISTKLYIQLWQQVFERELRNFKILLNKVMKQVYK